MIPTLNRLPARIIASFVVLFLVLHLSALALYRHYLGRMVQDRIQRQNTRISRVLSNSGFVLNAAYLGKLREVIEADIVVLEPADKIVVTTMSESRVSNVAGIVAQERFFSRLQTGPNAVITQIVDLDGTDTLLNARFLALDGQRPGKTILCILSPMDDVTAAEGQITLWSALVGGCGLVIAALAAAALARSVTDPVRKLVTAAEEIADGRFETKVPLPSVTELKTLSAAINAMTDRLREYEGRMVDSARLAASGKVAAAMAHEIRNPLSSIKMMTHLVRERVAGDPENTRIIALIMEEIVRLEKIVTSLIVRKGPPAAALKPEDMGAVIAEMLPMLAPKMKHRGIGLDCDIEPGVAGVRMDKDQIKQVVWNLVLNAMESIPGKGVVRVRVFSDETRTGVMVTVEDNGSGIDETLREKAFEPFFTTKPEGLGMGLSTSREIVAGHGGTLSLEAIDGGGTRATVAIPGHGKG